MGKTRADTLQAPDDRELLVRFVETNDQEAFGELVSRHGRMAMGVCRRILGDSAEAEDAFQAAFLILVSQAPRLYRDRDGIRSIGGWLHRVAANAALQVHRESKVRRHREAAVAHGREATKAPANASMVDLLPILDEELRRLPDRLRAPLVLCYFEDRSRQGAADELGISYATLRRRLDRARELLRSRLARRGCSIAPAVLASMLWDSASWADELALDNSEALARPIGLIPPSQTAHCTGLSHRSLQISRKVLPMIRNRTIQKATAVLLVLLLLGGAGLMTPDGLADDGSKPKAGSDPGVVAKEVASAVQSDGLPSRRKGGSEEAPARPPVPVSPKTQAPAPKPSPSRKAVPTQKNAPSKKAAPAAKNAPLPSETPELDREILNAINQGPFGMPGGQAVFQGMINVNGQTFQFNNPQAFNNAMGQMPRMGLPMPGMPGGGMNLPGMVPVMPINPLLFPGHPAARAGVPRRAAGVPKRRPTPKKARPKAAEAPRERAVNPATPRAAEEEFPSDGI